MGENFGHMYSRERKSGVAKARLENPMEENFFYIPLRERRMETRSSGTKKHTYRGYEMWCVWSGEGGNMEKVMGAQTSFFIFFKFAHGEYELWKNGDSTRRTEKKSTMRDDLSRPGGKVCSAQGRTKNEKKIKIRSCEESEPEYLISARGAILPEARLQGSKNSSVQGYEIIP